MVPHQQPDDGRGIFRNAASLNLCVHDVINFSILYYDRWKESLHTWRKDSLQSSQEGQVMTMVMYSNSKHPQTHTQIHTRTHKHTYIDAFKYLPEPNPRMINKVFIGTNERSDVWTSGVVLINIGHNVHCNMQIILWNLQGFLGATKLPLFHFRCVCVYVFCMTNCRFIGTKA